MELLAHENTNVVLGPPGTGKTHYIMSEIEKELEQKVQPEEIGVVTFTRSGAKEIIERASQRFGYPPERFPNIRTVHSMCCRILGLGPNAIMNRTSRQDFLVSINMWQQEIEDSPLATPTAGKFYFDCVENAASKDISLAQAMSEHPFKDDFLIQPSLATLEWFASQYSRYKDDRRMVDFNDMLRLTERIKDRAPALRSLYVDEAQDCSHSQWAVISLLSTRARRVVIVGDDDQSIYSFNGADVKTFQSIAKAHGSSVLEKSHRLPSQIQNYANDLIGNVSERLPKSYFPAEHLGQVRFLNDVSEVPYESHGGSWMMLARTNSRMSVFRSFCRNVGLKFSRTNAVGRGLVRESMYEARNTFLGFKNDPFFMATPRQVMALATVLATVKDSSVSLGLEYGVRSAMTKAFAGVASNMMDHPYYTYEMLQNAGFTVPLSTPWAYIFTALTENERQLEVDHMMSVISKGREDMDPVRIGTMHSSKGLQANNVVVLADPIGGRSRKFHTLYDIVADEEIRLHYVAVTRAKKNVFIVCRGVADHPYLPH